MIGISYQKIFISLSGIFLFLGCGLIPSLDKQLLEMSALNLIKRVVEGYDHSIGGEVRGLMGSGLTLELNVGGSSSPSDPEFLPIESNGNFTFQKEFPKDTTYTVTISNQPTNPTQICEVGGATGTITDRDVTSVLVQCGESLDVAQPVFNPPPGEFPSAVALTITAETPNSKIFYTMDGVDPTCTGVGSEYLGTINIPQPSLTPITVKAIACVEDRSSNLQQGDYRVTNGMLAMPTSSLATNPPNPSYSTSQSTTLSPPGTPAGATVHYTTDGTEPTCSSPSSPNPLTIASSMTVRAISCAVDWTASNVAVFPYLITGTVDTPTFGANPGGTYTNDVAVSLSVTTPGATIRYELTTDGTDPVPNCTSSPIASSPVTVNTTNTKIRAIGCLTDWNDSIPSAIQAYTLNVATPSLSPVAPSSILSTQTVSGSTTTLGSTIHYTTDGSVPGCGSSTTAPILNAPSDGTETSVTVRSIACKTGYNTSTEVSGVYTLTGTLNPPTMSPAPGTYTSGQNVSLSLGANNPAGTSIHFTTDGSDPTCASPTYGAAFSVASSQVVKAISCRTSPSWNPSSISVGNYTITGTVASPSFTPNPATTFNDSQSVTITSATPGATVYYYTADGAVPATPSCPSTGLTAQPISVTKNDTRIKAIACLTDWADSPVVDGVFQLQPGTPSPDIAPGSFGTGQNVTFTSTTGASIHIKTGSPTAVDPTCADPVGNTINLPLGSGDVQVKAIACRTDFQPSTIFSGTYSIGSQAPKPLFGVLDQNNELPITPDTFGSAQTICYRTDGADPFCSATNGGADDSTGGFCANLSNTVVGGKIGPLTASQTIRARSCSAANLQSDVDVYTFTLSGTVGSVVPSVVPGILNNDITNFSMTATNSTHIYFTINGATPDCTGTIGILHNGAPFTFAPAVTGANQLRAIACRAGYTPSAVLDATYTFQVANPTSPITGGTKTNDVSVSFSTATTGASIRYTTDSTQPTCASGTVYPGAPFSVPNASTGGPNLGIRAVGCKANYNPANYAGADMTFETATPVNRYAYNDAVIASNITTPSLDIKFDSPTTGSKICLSDVLDPNIPTPGCDGTTGNCIAGNIDLGASPAIRNYPADAIRRMATRACKPYYNQNTSTAVRIFTPSAGPTLRMFPTVNLYDGNLGGVAGADTKCNSDPGRPDSTKVYRALTAVTGIRDLATNWPFVPNENYFRADGTTKIFTTDASGIPVAPFDNSPSASVLYSWTGLKQFPFEVATDTCSNWTSANAVDVGNYGSSSQTTLYALATSASLNPCDQPKNLYCIEQPPPKLRVFVTTSTFDGAGFPAGKTDADWFCNNDTSTPATGTFKAMLRFSDRNATTDWVFKPNTPYFRLDKTTVIGTTDATGKLPADITPVETTNRQVFTAFGNDFGNTMVNCSNFTDSMGGSLVSGGNSNATTTNALLNSFSLDCGNFASIVCVEQ